MKITLRKLKRMTESEVIELISQHRFSMFLANAQFYVDGKYVDKNTVIKTFDVRPSHLQYVYEVEGVADIHEILECLRVEHVKSTHGVMTMSQLTKRCKPLTKDQVQNLLWLGKVPDQIIINAKEYGKQYRKGEVPEAETPMFA